MRALDQNRISSEVLFTSCRDPFLIPDITWFENIKADGWRDDVRRTFEAFHRQPHRLHIAHPVGRLLEREVQTGTPISDPVNWDGTTRLRELLAQQDYVTAIEQNVEALRVAGLKPQQDLPANRLSLQQAMDALGRFSGGAVMRQIRSLSRESKASIVPFAPSIASLTDRTLPHNLEAFGVPEGARAILSSRRSAFYRFTHCFWAQVFQYAIHTTVVQTRDDRLLNDFVDSDYAIVASYCDGLETGEDRLWQRYDVLVASIRQ
jgi:hypothetical protein